MNKKINAREIALKVLEEVSTKKAYANLALNKILNSNKQLTPLDRSFITELTYGVVKSTNTLDWFLQGLIKKDFKKLPSAIMNILRMGIYQIYFLDKIPVSAACNEAVNLTKKYGHPGTIKLVNAVLRNFARQKDALVFPDAQDNLVQNISLRYFHPEWLVKEWLRKFGKEETILLCDYNNQPSKLSARTNTLKISRDDLLKVLAENDVLAEKSLWVAEGIILSDTGQLNKLPAFKAGLMQIQDESSMLASHYLQVQAGHKVLDMCSAPGGKATHLAQLMNNDGKIIACDIHPHKLILINDNAKKLGIDIIETVVRDGTTLCEEFVNSMDRVLVDVPCSGLGVLGRRADARWHKNPQELEKLPELQLAILNNAAKYLKVGGRLVYSTCTMLAAENEDVVESFLTQNSQFKIVEIEHPRTKEILPYVNLYPQTDNMDGFFISVLERVI